VSRHVFLFIYLWSLEYFLVCIDLFLSVPAYLGIILSQLVQELSIFRLSGHQNSGEQSESFYLFKNRQTKTPHQKQIGEGQCS